MPWSLQTSFYPMNLVQGAARLIEAGDIAEGTVNYLGEALGLEQAGYRDMITVRAPDTGRAAFFKLPDDGRVSVVETRRTAFDAHGTPVRLTVSVYPADRNQFAVNMGRRPPTSLPRPARRTGHARAPDPGRRFRGQLTHLGHQSNDHSSGGTTRGRGPTGIRARGRGGSGRGDSVRRALASARLVGGNSQARDSIRTGRHPDFHIRPADRSHMNSIIGLINEAARWLKAYKDTDQWQRPWPNQTARDQRIHRGIKLGRTWIVEDLTEPVASPRQLVATVSCGRGGNRKLWTQRERNRRPYTSPGSSSAGSTRAAG